MFAGCPIHALHRITARHSGPRAQYPHNCPSFWRSQNLRRCPAGAPFMRALCAWVGFPSITSQFVILGEGPVSVSPHVILGRRPSIFLTARHSGAARISVVAFFVIPQRSGEICFGSSEGAGAFRPLNPSPRRTGLQPWAFPALTPYRPAVAAPLPFATVNGISSVPTLFDVRSRIPMRTKSCPAGRSICCEMRNAP